MWLEIQQPIRNYFNQRLKDKFMRFVTHLAIALISKEPNLLHNF